MKLQGQTVYVVHIFDSNDAVRDYEIFADRDEALEYEAQANKRAKKSSRHAYMQPANIR